MLLGGYLSLTLLLDIAQCRSMWLSAAKTKEFIFVYIFTTSVVAKVILIALESQQKRRWLQWEKADHSPEEMTGLYGLGTFIWLWSLFRAGHNKVLDFKDLFPLDTNLRAETLQDEFYKRIGNVSLQGERHALAKILCKTLAVPLLLPIVARVALMGFMFSQPFLIQSLLSHLEQPENETSKNIGYGLVGATIFIYSGICISNAFYWYLHERFLCMARACLTGAVYRQLTIIKLSAGDKSSALTLMSTDVERVRRGLMNLHEFWANTIEVALASWLLQRQLGVAFIAPISIVLLCVIASGYLARYANPRQKAWMEKVQRRVGFTSGVIGNMKNLKMSGLSIPVRDTIQRLRAEELKAGSNFRFIQIIATTIAFTPLSMSPVVTFAVTSKQLDISTAFTSLAYLLLLSNPLSMIFQTVPAFIAAFTCLTRIQEYLEVEPRKDFRERIEVGSPSEKASTEVPSKSSLEAISIRNGAFGWIDGQTNIQNIDITIPDSKLTLVVGPVASGKSILSKAMLGELSLAAGRVVLGSHYHRIGYCDQTPFLSNATIRNNIVGFSAWDNDRYEEVIAASMLSKDLMSLPNGDLTKVGSDGIMMSGGQKQRVSLARALYLEANLLIFDDVLSGLDPATEEQVFRRVFGPEGLLRNRNATAILCTHSVRHLPSADHIVALGSDGKLIEEGDFPTLVDNKQYVYSLRAQALAAESSHNNTPAPQSSDTQAYHHKFEQAAPLASPQSDRYRRLGDKTVYKHYFSRIGWRLLTIFLTLGAFNGFLFNWQTIWITLWSRDIMSPAPTYPNAFYVGLFFLFQALCLASVFCFVCVSFLFMVSVSGAALHKAALQTVISASLRFLTTTDSGVITNLFSQDMTLIDSELPVALTNVVLVGGITLGMVAVIATSSPYIIISYPPLAILLYWLQKFYLATSRQLRLLDLEAKSPLYTHFLDTMKGLASIRAFGWVDSEREVNNMLLDASQRPAYLLAMIQRWLAFTLNAVVTIMAVLVVTVATQVRSNTAFTGASLVTIMSFGESLSDIIRAYTQLETSIGAVSRLKLFSENTKSENQPGEDVHPPKSWPEHGCIEIKDLSASYG